GTSIAQGTLMQGSLAYFGGNPNYVWRHWGCVSPRVLRNMKSSLRQWTDQGGSNALTAEDQERVRKAWVAERVAEEDIPLSGRRD
ncbi:hypothetical protein BU17DRAFT_36177, partial [Hysterangium stoloniferum]